MPAFVPLTTLTLHSINIICQFRPKHLLNIIIRLYTVERVFVFPVPSWDVTKQTLPGRELLHYSQQERVWLLTSRLGTGKRYPFLQCTMQSRYVFPSMLSVFLYKITY
jgi:hypothetical protein